MLDIINISYQRQERTLFTHINYQLKVGELLLISGENGSGKSSLLRLLTGCNLQASGEIRWQGNNIDACLADYRQHLHYIAHSNGLKLGLTVKENIRLMQHLFCMHPCFPIEEVLEELNLTAHLHQLVCYLSAGQQRRLTLAKLLLFPRCLWIVDEPLTALDPAIQLVFLRYLAKHLNEEGGMVVMSSHQPIPFNQHKNKIHFLRLGLD